MAITAVLVSQLPSLMVVVGAGPIMLLLILLLLLLLPRILLLLLLNIGVLSMLSLVNFFNYLLILLFFTLKSSPGGKVTSLMVVSVITLAMIISWKSIQ